jgi:peptidoglycan/LPS O-acetylase OafA/YrhL
MGSFGVDIFFALSGLLITSRLLDEEAITGSLHLKGFYLRRFMRIQPVALLYLAVVALLALAHRLPPDWSALLAALLFFRNLVQFSGPTPDASPGTWPTAHFWSLSVEEQFYLFLPIFLFILRRGRGWFLMSLALVDILWYLRGLAVHHGQLDVLSFRTDYSVHFLLLASALAVFLRNEHVRSVCTRILRPGWIVPLTLALLPDKSPLHILLFLMPCLLVLSSALHPGKWLGRFLESRPLRFAGRISYSLYIWQMIFLSGFFAPSLHTFGNMQRVWLFLPLTVLTAYLSYRYIEKPFIRLGHRLAPPATAGRPELLDPLDAATAG